MNALSYAAATRCEEAAEPVCKCRCNGQFHGAKRGTVGSLPFDDPHFPGYSCDLCGGIGRVALYGTMVTCRRCDGRGFVVTRKTLQAINAEIGDRERHSPESRHAMKGAD